MSLLLTRDTFRSAVFKRDGYLCVHCGKTGQDAHHIIERRLFPDGGYYLDNGVTVCGPCHLLAESTEISCELLRECADIDTVVLPPHLYKDETYDKWGNVILANGSRLRGELFEDPSVQKILAPVLHLFTNRVKYPRTWHFHWSEGATSDDRILSPLVTETWGEVVTTEKMDGECTTMYRDGIHARSIDYNPHPSRDWIRNFHASIAYNIPENFRICGENLTMKHSIYYPKLTSFFQVFSIWDGCRCLSWDETKEYAALLGLSLVPELQRHHWNDAGVPLDDDFSVRLANGQCEGYVVRPAGEFTLREFPTKVGKYVRKNHVTTHGHWMCSRMEPNHLA